MHIAFKEGPCITVDLNQILNYVMLTVRLARLDFSFVPLNDVPSFQITKKMSPTFSKCYSILHGPCVSQWFRQRTVTLQCIKMRLFDELSRCEPLTTQKNIYSGKER